jgi:hypothetical protein
MDPAYTDRLESVVRKLPEAPCALGLVVASGADWVPAAAGDLAATVSRGRAGHTILVSLASDEPDLDHELGVEPRLGLSDVLAGAASLKDVAARSAGRGYIYLPQGASPLRGRRVLESRAWRKLQDSALARGATLLILLPPEAICPGPELRLMGLVLLGVEPDALPAVGDGEALPPVLGALHPPAGGTEAPSPHASATGGSRAPPAASRPVVTRPRHRRKRPRGRRPRSGSSESMPAVRRGGSRKKPKSDPSGEESGRSFKAPAIAVVVIVALVAVIALVVAAVSGARNRAPFLEQNDSLWLAPVPAESSDSAGTPADSAATTADSEATANSARPGDPVGG